MREVVQDMSDLAEALRSTDILEQLKDFAKSAGVSLEQVLRCAVDERVWEEKAEQETHNACIRILMESAKVAGILLSDAQAEELLSKQPIPVTTGQLYEIMPTLLVEAASRFPDSVIL